MWNSEGMLHNLVISVTCFGALLFLSLSDGISKVLEILTFCKNYFINVCHPHKLSTSQVIAIASQALGTVPEM